MPPKTKITRESIISAAIEIIRHNGSDSLNARSIAAHLKCSTQPIFTNFSGMDDLREAVIEKADEIFARFMENVIKSGDFPPYKASGMAYIRFAAEEKELFKLLYMRDRSSEAIPSETELGNQMDDMVQINTGLNGSSSKLFHMEMWAFVHGIASMTATCFLNLDQNIISTMLTDMYQGLKMRYERKE